MCRILAQFVTCTTIFFLWIFCISYSSAQEDDSFQRTKHVLSTESRWSWAPVGRFSAKVLNIFYSSSENIVNDTLSDSNDVWEKFLKVSLGSIVKHEIGVTIVTACGCLITCVLVFTPLFIFLYRKRKKKATEHRSSNTEQGESTRPRNVSELVLYVFLIIFLCFSIFGGILLIAGSLRTEKSIPVGFNVADRIVDSTFMYKTTLPKSYQWSLSALSRRSHKALQTILIVHEDIRNVFLNESMKFVGPAIDQSELTSLKMNETLSKMKKEEAALFNSLDKSTSALEKAIKEYHTALKSLIQKLNSTPSLKQKFLTQVNELLTVSELILDLPSRKKLFDDSIESFKTASEHGLVSRIIEIREKIDGATTQFRFNTDKLASTIKRKIFLIQMTLSKSFRPYLVVMNKTFPPEERNTMKDKIKKVKEETESIYSSIYPVFVTLGVIGCILSVTMFIFFTVGIIANSGSNNTSSSGGSQNVKLNVFDFATILLLFICYVTAFVLWLFWLLSVYLFTASGVPHEICIITKDMSLFDIILQNPSYRNTTDQRPWFAVHESPEFNISLKQTLYHCEKEHDYFFMWNISSLVNTTFSELEANATGFKPSPVESLAKLPLVNLTSALKSLKLLSGVTAGFPVEPIFLNLTNFVKHLKSINAWNVLRAIEKSPDADTAIKADVKAALNSYQKVVSSATFALSEYGGFETRIQYLNSSVRQTIVSLTQLVKYVEAMNDFLKNKTSSAYNEAVSSSLLRFVIGMEMNLLTSLHEMKKRLSSCPLLNILYDKSVFYACNYLNYAVLVTWMGSTILSIFLLFAEILCVISIPPHLFNQPRYQRSSTEVPRSFTADNSKHKSEVPEQKSEAEKAGSEAAKAESESPKAKSESPKAGSESPKAESESPKAKSESPKAGSESSKAKSESPKAGSEPPKQGSEPTKEGPSSKLKSES